MTSQRFKFLTTEAFSRLTQSEKLAYLARATSALGKTLGIETEQRAQASKHEVSPGTLGAVLYANRTRPAVLEQEWIDLVRSVAGGDQIALHGLYERAHRPVYSLIMRIAGNKETAEGLTLDVFYDVWRGAALFDAEGNTVLGWIMNLARFRAVDRTGIEPRRTPASPRRASDPRPAASLQRQLARRIFAETDRELVLPPARQWSEPAWDEVAPGISCKLLAKDTERDRISMLVRLVPGGSYPAHTHAGVEELHLLGGELWIEDRKLHPGDYNRGEPGTGDKRVWSETGCTCVLITSTNDVLA